MSKLSPAQIDQYAKDVLHTLLISPIGYVIITGSIGTLTYPIYNSYNIFNIYKNIENKESVQYRYNKNNYLDMYCIPSNTKYNLYVDEFNMYNYIKGDTYGKFILRNHKGINYDMLAGFITGTMFIITFPYYMFMRLIGHVVDKIEEIEDK